MRRSGGGSGYTTSLLPAVARASPGFRPHHPVVGTFPSASRILSLQPNNKTPRLAQSPGRVARYVPAGEA